METEAVKVLLSRSLLLKCTLFRTNHCSCPESCLSPPEICSDTENKSSFGDFFLLQMLNLIRKEKVILRGLGKKKGRREGGVGGENNGSCFKKQSRQGWSITMQCRKVRQKHKNISGQQLHWAKCALCLSDVVVVDGFLTAPSCFSL